MWHNYPTTYSIFTLCIEFYVARLETTSCHSYPHYMKGRAGLSWSNHTENYCIGLNYILKDFYTLKDIFYILKDIWRNIFTTIASVCCLFWF